MLYIVGMHRSGTSALTRCMNLGGLYLGKPEDLIYDPAVSGNFQKQWEHKEFVEINDAILEQSGGSWDSPPRKTSSLLKTHPTQDIRKKIQTFEKKFSSYSKVCFKDPRLLFTCPLWINSAKTKPLFIGIIRRPLEVAQSLLIRDGFPVRKGLVLWELYNIKLLELKARYSFPIFTFQELLQNTDKTLHKVARYIKFTTRIDVQFDFKQIHNYIDSGKGDKEEPTDCPDPDLYMKELSSVYRRINNSWSTKELTLRCKSAFEKMENVYISERLGLAGEVVRIPRGNLNRSTKSGTNNPLISLVVPIFNAKPEWINLCLNSVLNQIYAKWELCLYDDNSTSLKTLKMLNKWKDRDKRIKIYFGKTNKGLTTALNIAIKMASGEYIAFLDHVSELTSDALLEVAERIKIFPNLKFIYSDEGIIDKKGTLSTVYYKPDFNLDLFLSNNYISHFTVIKKSLGKAVGWFRKGYEGSQNYDFLLRSIEKIKYNEIHHIPRVLYYSRESNSGTAPGKYLEKTETNKSSIKALEDYLRRNKIDGQVLEGKFHGTFRIKRNIAKEELVSIIIPFKDRVKLLKKCVDSLLIKTAYKDFEILLINNGSKERTTLQYLEKIIKKDRRISRYDYNYPFNYSALNNWAVKKSKGKYLLFLNNDTEVISEEWLSSMVEHIQRKEVGAVGAKLLYKNNTIQHAGVVIAHERHSCSEHIFRHIHSEDSGYFGQLNLIRNCSASTAACFLIKKKLFEKIGRFDDKYLKISFNDIDLCLKIIENGYLIVYTPYAELYHYESISRGYDDMPEKKKVYEKELRYMQNKWNDKLLKDPHFNPNLIISSPNLKITSEGMERFMADSHKSQYTVSMNMFDLNHNTGETIGNVHFCFTTKHKKGHCIYGPGINVIENIKFSASFFIEFLNIFDKKGDLIVLDVYDSKSNKILKSKSVLFRDLKSIEEKFSLKFKGAKSQVLEFRVFWNKNCDIAVSKIVLEKR